MGFDAAKQYLTEKGFADRILTFEVSSATVELAAQAVGTEPAKIAKSLSFMTKTGPVLILCAGDAKVNNAKYKQVFGEKAKMLSFQEVGTLIGHEVGGVCPFGIKAGVRVYLDVNLKPYDTVYPACGNAASAVRLTPQELKSLTEPSEWIDVCVQPSAEM